MGTGPARPILRLRRRPLPRPGSGCPTAQLTIAGGPGRDYVEHPKVGVFALPGGFGGGNGTVMLPTGHPVLAGDAIYVLEGFF